ncbi:MAG TPA: DUF2079 domain-containing protein [Acidimicrobiales bacterium]|nr:DUF2079 domain-containing protein [Acidimicrobiales bacterium]
MALVERAWHRASAATVLVRRAPTAAKERLAHIPQLAPVTRILPLLVLMSLYAARFSEVSVASLRAFQQDAYDLSLYDQGIWLLSRFHAPFMTVMGTDMFAAHTVFVFLLLVPLFWVYPHTALLLVLQAIAAAAGAIPVYLIARRLLERWWPALLLAAAYLLNPGLQQGNLEQFHVEAFEAPLLGFAIYAVLVWRPRLLATMVALLLLCKQDDALYVVPIGLWVLSRHHRKAGAAIITTAVAVASVENLVLIPALLNGVPTSYAGWWPFQSLSGTLRVLIRHPGQFLNFATGQGRPFYVWQMLFSGGLTALAAPWVLLIALPELAADALSSNPYLHQIDRHYAMPLAAVLACAGVFGVARLPRARWRSVATVVVAICALWSCVLWGAAPFSDNAPYVAATDTASVHAIDALLARIPPDAVVSAGQNFVPNLDHRRQIYMFPTPFKQSYYGNPANDGKRLPFASSVQYLVLPHCIYCDGNLGESAQQVFNSIAAQFRVVGAAGGVVLYERAPPK